MAFLRPPLSLVWIALLLLLSICAVVARDKPDIDSTKFDSPPVGLQYFEDSESVLVLEERKGILWRSNDAGKKWKEADGVEHGVASFWLHPTDKKKAYALGRGRKHWITTDQGDSWRAFELPDNAIPSRERLPLSFHAGNSAKVIFNAQENGNILHREELAYYTTDDFKETKLLAKYTRGCVFAHATPEFKPTKQDADDDRTLCIQRGKKSIWPWDNVLMVSDDFMARAAEPQLEAGRVVRGLISMAVVKGYLVAAVKARGTAELALYVTVDAEHWHRALFPQEHKIEENAYTVLESTNYSIQVDVMTTLQHNPMGILFSSNSAGQYFTENIRHMNRNYEGIVDFEKIQNIQGILMVNVVDNWKDVERNARTAKKIKSQISFDDGRTWSDMKIEGKSDSLHVHSVTDMRNSGKIFSSPAPGLVMAVGNTGDFLQPYNEGDLYISDDAGLTWKKALNEAHKYEFGDQGGIVVAVNDEGPADKVDYSLNHGQDWKSVDLDAPLDAKILTTVPDSTSRKFLLEATRRNRKENKIEYLIYALNFDGLDERKCEDGDFEDWSARVDKDGKPTCLMGHKQFFRRRKKDADCFIGAKNFNEALPKSEPCLCAAQDFECDFNFIPEGDGTDKKCVPAAPVKPKNADDCKAKDGEFMGPSGWRLIPGNDCIREGGEEKDKEIKRPCKDAAAAPAKSGKIVIETTEFRADSFGQKVYLERSGTSHGQDETIIMSTVRDRAIDKLYKTKDQGKTWKPILEDVKNIQYILKHEYENDAVYILTGSKDVHYSINRGDQFHKFTVPHRLDSEITPLSFHPDFKDYLIWIGQANCDPREPDFDEHSGCHMVASYTTDRGNEWKTLVRYCEKCEFIRQTAQTKSESNHLIYCEAHKEEELKNPLELRSSEDWFAESKQEVDDILTFVTMSEFIIVAQKDRDSNLKIQASVDAQTFADAHFPPNFNVPHKTAYTALDSSTHAIFLHVTENEDTGQEYGSILKSNSNGTSYVLSIDAVNRNKEGYVDFEKMQGIEGVAMVNVVDNLDEEASSDKKKLKSKITHNDGSQWALLQPPAKDVDEHAWPCDTSNVAECSLHLHSYTERSDPRDTFSSPSAVGLMMGVGNVGRHLSWKGGDDVYTFITRNAGISWEAVRKGNYMWEYGDQGSLIVIVEEAAETDVGYYTLNEGRDWTEFRFAERKVKVSDLTTVPSDGSKSFVIWASSGSKVLAINVDFSGLRDRTCVLNENSGSDDEGDFVLWSPTHPLQPDGYCLFGHVTKYHRKKPDADCWIGTKFVSLHDKDFQENCTCTRQDFECDYNYELQNEKSCRLVPGLQDLDPARVCESDPRRIGYHEHRGYRKIPISTCRGGEEEKYLGPSRACPGHSLDEDPARYGGAGRLSGLGFFIVVVLLPLAAAAAVGWVVYRRFEGSFGRIRLGESVGPASGGGSGVGQFLRGDQPWIRYPVMGVSALVAVLVAVPLLAGAAARAVGGWFGGGRRYTTRQSFAEGRGQYAVVDPDEDELLGVDDEEGDGV